MRALLLAAALAVASPAFAAASALPPRAPSPGPADAKIAPWLRDRLAGGAAVEFLVVLDDAGRVDREPASPATLYPRLVESARASQAGLLAELAARNVPARAFHLVDAVLVRGDLAFARTLAARGDVRRLVGNPRVRALGALGTPAAPDGSDAPEAVEWGVAMVRAPETWDAFTRGQGIVVASADTGVEWTHAALQDQYRGWDPASGIADHRYAWHDAFASTTAPWDDNNHGTHTTGTMVGTGTGIGVAPGARWIACRNMDFGYGTPAGYIDCMEWFLAPYPQGGDPARDGRPELAPHIVNNSWYCPASEGCDWTTLEDAFARLRQAGILAIVSAGNSGSSCSTIADPPGIYGNVESVGAVNSAREVTSFSSRGPILVDGSNRRKPDLAAPGEQVRSSIPGNTYAVLSGTSMAAPHVSGAAALLWSARPELRGQVDLTRCVLERAASPDTSVPGGQVCGTDAPGARPNNVYGWGIVDAYAALTLPRTDADIAPDPCDCRPADAGVFAEPVEASGLRYTSKTQLAWTSQSASAGSATVYDLVRGNVGAPFDPGSIGAGTCAARDLAGPSAPETSTPARGTANWFLVRARNACAVGPWGTRSDGTPRVNAACDN